VIVGDGVGLHQRDDHEAAAAAERAHLERRPGERPEPGGVRRGSQADRPGAADPDQHLEAAAAHEREHDERPGQGARREPGGDVGDPAQVPGTAAGPPPGRRRQVERRPHRDRGDGRAAARAGGTHPARGRRREEERRKRDDDDEAGDDEPRAADERSRPAAHPSGEEDGELRR